MSLIFNIGKLLIKMRCRIDSSVTKKAAMFECCWLRNLSLGKSSFRAKSGRLGTKNVNIGKLKVYVKYRHFHVDLDNNNGQ